ncbi:uncharacterized protein Tco025E_08777 [Trypanosoma conorhini]|uniref:Uncharacterized protein n=1 Tax=Trypanosoma conorhini TaxID=83891 RepID=A0A422N579_9TRYP|nr:uncharacterized protein Tco025E_08777 [Trypanosoma conorhini]RNF00619.1 hypothetical protein Tco025E_08777 [Trypanosoma conorhini]
MHRTRPSERGKRDEVIARQDRTRPHHGSITELAQKSENVLFFLHRVFQDGEVFAQISLPFDNLNPNVARSRGVVRPQRRMHASAKSDGHRGELFKIISLHQQHLHWGARSYCPDGCVVRGQRKQQKDEKEEARRRRRGPQAKVRTATTPPPAHRHTHRCLAIVLLCSL